MIFSLTRRSNNGKLWRKLQRTTKAESNCLGRDAFHSVPDLFPFGLIRDAVERVPTMLSLAFGAHSAWLSSYENLPPLERWQQRAAVLSHSACERRRAV